MSLKLTTLRRRPIEQCLNFRKWRLSSDRFARWFKGDAFVRFTFSTRSRRNRKAQRTFPALPKAGAFEPSIAKANIYFCIWTAD